MLVGNHVNEDYKRCALKCKNGKHFFRLPTSPRIRKIWTKNLGLKSVSVSTRICDNHFTEQMFTASGRRLTKAAFPNKNIPLPVNGDLNEDDSSHLEIMLDNLLSEVSPGNNNTPQKTPTSQPEATLASAPINSNKLLNNHRLPNQSKNLCNVTELPQFILVFTAFRTREELSVLRDNIMPPTDDDNAEEIPPIVPKSPQKNNKLSKFKTSKRKPAPPDQGKAVNLTQKPITREFKYVRYTPTKDSIQRDREVQAHASNITRTAEIGVQCSTDDETDRKDDSSELEWINNIIEAHVFNIEGEMYECHVCGEIAANYASKEEHSLMHKESSSLCFQCGRLFSSHVKLKNHERKVHLERKFEIKKAMRCPKIHCTKAFHSRKQLFNHIDEHSKRTGKKRCNLCQREFTSAIQLYCHKSRRKCWR